jgi:membrane protein implicated in regulation of membrane protease activity
MFRRFAGDYSLSLALAGLFLFSWFIQTIAGWFMYVAEQHEHNQMATLFGESGYIWEWAEATFENWQSEFLQLFTFVVLSAFLIHRHSHESRDDQDELKKQVEELLAELKERNKNG